MPPPLRPPSMQSPSHLSSFSRKGTRHPRTTYVQLFPDRREKNPDDPDDTLSLPDLPSLKASLPKLRDQPSEKTKSNSAYPGSARSRPTRPRNRKTLVWREPLVKHDATLSYRYYDFRKMTKPKKRKVKKRTKSRSPSRNREQRKSQNSSNDTKSPTSPSKLSGSPVKPKQASSTKDLKVTSPTKNKHSFTKQPSTSSSPSRTKRHSTNEQKSSCRNRLTASGSNSTNRKSSSSKSVDNSHQQQKPIHLRHHRLNRIDVNEMTIGGYKDNPIGWQAAPRRPPARTPSPPSLLQRFLEHSSTPFL